MTTSLQPRSTTEPIAPVPRLRDAYQHLAQEISAVPDNDLVPINIDVPAAVTLALGVWPKLHALRAKITEEMPKLDLTRFDKMEDYTLALGHAQALYQAASTPIESIPELADKAASLRDQLLSDASALAKRGLVDGESLTGLKGPVGYRNVAFDLMTLAALLRENWDGINGKTAIEPAELDDAETIADRLLTNVGLREQEPAAVVETAKNRQRAFTLFINAYDEARRAITFLRWREDDVDQIAPSRYTTRASPRQRPSPEPQPASPPAAAPKGATAAKAAGGFVPTSKAPVGSTPAGSTSAAPTPSGSENNESPGLPGSSPFLNA